MNAGKQISLAEGRFSRFEAIEWWDQSLLRESRVLVVGAGALGNEVIKNLSLLGVGNLTIVDMDRVEASNLSRSILFRPADEGQAKAAVAAEAAKAIYPDIKVTPLMGNVLCDMGLGHFRWAQVVVGALDNREARVFINRVCAQVQRPWIDGGIEVLNGIVRGFEPPQSACYECTMGQADWDLLAERRSCSLLARRAIDRRGTPTTPTSASVIGAIQAQEVVKKLHGIDFLAGAGYVFEGRCHESYKVGYPISPDCPWHETQPPIRPAEDLNSETPLRTIWRQAEAELGGVVAIDLSRELVERLECPGCGRSERTLQCIDNVTEDQAVCAACGTELVPHFVHSIQKDSDLLELSASGLGLPRWDVLWARGGENAVGIELAGDSPEGLGCPRPKE